MLSVTAGILPAAGSLADSSRHVGGVSIALV